jgi:hypothetical protein
MRQQLTGALLASLHLLDYSEYLLRALNNTNPFPSPIIKFPLPSRVNAEFQILQILQSRPCLQNDGRWHVQRLMHK